MAHDIGREAAHHQALSQALGIPVCFAHEHSL
jgi:IS30 family transposase